LGRAIPDKEFQLKLSEKRYQYISRFLASDEVNVVEVMTSYGRELSEKLTACGEQLILILDQSKVENGFEMLMVSISMVRSSLPLLWHVQKNQGVHRFLRTKAITLKSIPDAV